MSGHGHIADRAGFLAALAKSDPERRLAEQHVRACAACREAFAEGDRLVALLGEALPLSPPTPEAIASAATAIEREKSIERRHRRLLAGGAAAAVGLAWVLQLLYGKTIARDARNLIASLAVLAAAVASVTLAQARARLAVAAMIVTSALAVLIMGAVPSLAPRPGVACTLCELAAAAIPWLVVAGLARWREIAIDRSTMVLVAAAGALASQSAQVLSCPVPHASLHLLVFHFGGFLLAMALGAVIPRGAPVIVHAEQ
jgi:hypothetical protein